MTRAVITGWGAALPSDELTNGQLAERLGVTEDWIFQRTGIRTRRVVGPGESTATLATRASRLALERADIRGADIDLVVLATTTPDLQLPATACLVQASLGCTNAAAFDLNAACAGFLFALAQATSQIECGACSRILVCGADTLSSITDYGDPSSCVLFGDGAGAVVVEASESSAGIGPFILRTDGSDPGLLYVRHDEGVIRMQGREVYRRAVEAMSESLSDLAEQTGVALSEIDLVVAHQANARIVEAVAARLGFASDRVALNIEHVGNTSAASIPLALAEAADQGRLHEGSLVALTAFGAGFSWGAGLVRWGSGTAQRGDDGLRELVGSAAWMADV